MMIDYNHNKIEYNEHSKQIRSFCILIDKEYATNYIGADLYTNKIYKILIPFRREECLRTNINNLIKNEKIKII